MGKPAFTPAYYTTLAYLASGAHDADRPDEEWRRIEGLTSEYSISSYGRVRNEVTGLVRKASVHRQGYLKHSFYIAGRQVTRYVHRLVAEAFLPPSHHPYVRHLDDDKTNNTPSNLAWGRPIDNTLDAQRNGLIKPPFIDGKCKKRGHPQEENDISLTSRNFSCRACRTEWERDYRRKKKTA